MKVFIFLILLLFPILCIAQIYNEVLSPSIPGVQGTFDFGDLDSDGDLDLVVVGRVRTETISLKPTADILINDGDGNYALSDEMLNPIRNSAGDVELFDADNDGDLDILIIGENDEFEPTTSFYLNNGSAEFSQIQDNGFADFRWGEIATADVDLDGDLDVFITGSIVNTSGDNEETSRLYLNLGGGNFIQVNNTLFEPIAGSASFADLNSDGSPDLVISGQLPSLDRKSIIYLNNGFGVFNQTIDDQLQDLASGDIEIFDIDGDLDNDIVISGNNSSTSPSMNFIKLYLNQGGENFLEIGNSQFPEMSIVTINSGDYDDDGDIDMILTGSEFNGVESISRTILYDNNGFGQFAESNENFLGLSFGNAKFADIDGDTDLDILAVGVTGINDGWNARLYKNGILSSIERTIKVKDNALLFPNPIRLSQNINLTYDKVLNGEAKVRLFNYQGRLIFSDSYYFMFNQNLNFPNGIFPTEGIYTVHLEFDHRVLVNKVLVIK